MINFKTFIAALAFVFVSGTVSAAYLTYNTDAHKAGASYDSIYNDDSKSDYDDKKKDKKTKKEKYGY